MSFRSRLLLFFAIIVVFPMAAVGFVLLNLTSQSRFARADAQVSQALEAAGGAFTADTRRAANAFGDVAKDRPLRFALALDDRGDIRRAVRRIGRTRPALRALVVSDRKGREVARYGERSAIAFATADVEDPKGRRIGTIAVSNTRASGYAAEVAGLTALEVEVARGGKVLASTLVPGARRSEPHPPGSLEIGADEYRGGRATVGDPTGRIQVGVFAPVGDVRAAISGDRRLVLGLLVVFLVLALGSSILVVRALQAQIASFLDAARAIGSGRFDRRVPIHGNDEFSALGAEFNSMSEQLEAKIAEVERQRRELEESIRRVGEAFAAGLDPGEVVAVAVRTAVEACGAGAGRSVPADGGEPIATAGRRTDELDQALAAAEARALEDAREAGARDERPAREVVEMEVEGSHALAAPLGKTPDDRPEPAPLAVLSIARAGEPFSGPEREIFAYLAARAATSIENATLHRAVREQAVTDGLTGLYNRRHFSELLDAEIGRADRSGSRLGLLIADIDGFKRINDTHGHQAGDRALVHVAELLRSHARVADQFGRYGGDELMAMLPDTDLDGAERFAERVRAALEAAPLEVDGGRIPLTVSVGAAEIPASASDRAALLAAADRALYEAKRAGRNRVRRAERATAPR